MALIKLNIDTLKKDSKGILNKLVDNVVNKIEDKLENAVEDLFASALKKVGISDNIARQLSSRFGDAFSSGMADKYFQSSTSEQDRVSPQEICENVIPRDGAETSADAVKRTTNAITNIAGVGNDVINQFPSQIGKYYFSMKFANYQRSAPQSVAQLKFEQAFILPLPRELKESFDIKVSEKDQGTAGGIMDAAQAYFTEGSNFDTARAAETLLLSKIVQSAGEFGDAIGQIAGAVPNPHVAAIFSGVGLRTHRFEWTFSPRNREESRKLQDIIWKLKKFSLPSYSENGTAALQYPMLVQIDLYPWADGKNEEDKLVRFKPALLSDVSINYSPQGIPSFFRGTNLPTFVQLSLEFLETEIWTSNAYGRQGQDRIEETMDLFADALDIDRDAIYKSVNEVFGQNSDGTGQTADTATGQSGTQTPQAAKTDTPFPLKGPKILKQNEAVKNNIQTMATSTNLGVAATNPDQRGTNYNVYRGGFVDAVDPQPFNDGKIKSRPANKYVVDKTTKTGGKTRIGEFTTAAQAYNALVSQGAF